MAQDSVKGGTEPIVNSIDPARLTYDYLVDGNLPQDDPAAKKFKTLQAAYAAAPAGTKAKPTVIGIRPNVYQLPGHGLRGPSLSITKNYITLLGLTDNRRTVVLADNRGLMQGADDDGYVIDVNATGFTAKNLTIINYCNADYEYPGDPGKNLTRRSDVITQGVALQAAGDKHVYENVALLGRLDTMFLRTTRSWFKNVYIEGTDDWMGGGQISVWGDCTLVFPTGSGVMSASGIVFFNCRFEATGGMRFYKAEFRSASRPNVLINCVLPVDSAQAHVAWVRGPAAPRPNQLSLTWHNKDADGHPAVIYDSTVGMPAFTYSRELSEQELPAFNPWNLLRATPNGPADDWDPAGVRSKYESAGQGNLPFRIALANGSSSIRTGGPGATIGATVTPTRADQTIIWSTRSDLISLSRTTGSNVVVTGRNTTSQAEWVAVRATATNGIYVTASVYVEPKYTDPPAVTAGPTIHLSADGAAIVDYTLDLHGREDQSLVSWYLCDDASGINLQKIAVTRGDQPLKTLPLTPGYVGKYLKVTVQPKHNISDPGPEVQVVTAKPVVAADVRSATISPDFRNFVPDTNDTYVSGLWTVLGTWAVVTGDDFVHGYGIRPSTRAYLLYQQDADCGDMQVDLVMASEKAGQGFSVPGSPAESGPRNLHADVYIKYDPRTRNGYALRFWRTTRSADKCLFQLYKIENGTGLPLNDQQVLSGVFKTTTHMTLKVTGTTLAVTASNDVDQETLALEGTIVPNRFGGAGVYWPGGGSSTIYSRLEISYPGAAPAK
ncbi:MAG TPA: pectinesterase family protein [Verrucomicrobiae bacterium]|nr:pectinesterase family protein [Verrucomicrobiae bacterium]